MSSSRLSTCLAGLASAFFAALFAAAVAIADTNTAITVPVVSSGNGASFHLRFDRNGRFAVFTSEAGNLVPGQVTGGRRNVFLYDRIGGGNRLVSHLPGLPATGGNDSVAPAITPQISADGKWVAFTSAATDLVAGQIDSNAALDVFLWSQESDTTLLVSRQAGTATTAGNGASKTPDRLITVSDDGRYVVFASSATNLVQDQAANGFLQLYQFDRISGTVRLISHGSAGELVSGGNRSEFSFQQEGRGMSSDGRFVAFNSLATNLVAGVTDSNGNFDVYLWDRDAAAASSLRLLSRRGNNPLAAGNGSSDQSSISDDGRFVAFTTRATDLEGVGTDTNGATDVYRYGREEDFLELVSHRSAGAVTAANGASTLPVISAGGDQIAFVSAATNLSVLQDDTNGVDDIFLWTGAAAILVSHVSSSNFITGNGSSRRPVIGADGGVGFTTLATDLVAGVVDTNSSDDAFYRPRSGAAPVLVSHIPSEAATGNNDSSVAQVLFGGGLVAFESQARDLVDGPINGGTNLFHHGSLIMADGFETADFSAWSQALP